MQATLTEVQRATKKVFRPVHSGHSVSITEHGKPVARIVPDCERQEVTLEDFFKSEITDEAILSALKESQP